VVSHHKGDAMANQNQGQKPNQGKNTDQKSQNTGKAGGPSKGGSGVPDESKKNQGGSNRSDAYEKTEFESESDDMNDDDFEGTEQEIK
jgi:hypothetical protein